MDMEDSCSSLKIQSPAVRWVFNFEDWKPEEEEWQHALSMIPTEEKERILRFKRPVSGGFLTGRHNPNAKSSLIGRLMLRKCAQELLDIAPNSQIWARTPEGKPYLRNKMPSSLMTFTGFDGITRAGWNMNVSHAGKFVAFAAGSNWVMGVDVMSNIIPYDEPPSVFFSYFQENFTAREWSVIHGHKLIEDSVRSFFVNWTLKESYIKSIGIGLGFELLRADFKLDDTDQPKTATVCIDGQEKHDWYFEVHNIPGHTISVSYGPAKDSIPSIQNSIEYPGPKKHSNPFPLFPPPRIEFVELTMIDLLAD